MITHGEWLGSSTEPEDVDERATTEGTYSFHRLINE
jgi:hypothetical protein